MSNAHSRQARRHPEASAGCCGGFRSSVMLYEGAAGLNGE
jgi:hypothetical protein